jgi:predicted HAD superfamily Cof-like phosphohydrolase
MSCDQHSTHAKVAEFHRVFGHPINQPWSIKLGALRAVLIAEECQELREALLTGETTNIAHELADLTYVVLGTAVALGTDPGKPAEYYTGFSDLYNACVGLVGPLLFGDTAVVAARLSGVIRRLYGMAASQNINLDTAVAEVHRANLSKLDDDGHPIYRSDGKVLKSRNYRKPDCSSAVLDGAT